MSTRAPPQVARVGCHLERRCKTAERPRTRQGDTRPLGEVANSRRRADQRKAHIDLFVSMITRAPIIRTTTCVRLSEMHYLEDTASRCLSTNSAQAAKKQCMSNKLRPLVKDREPLHFSLCPLPLLLVRKGYNKYTIQ